MAAANNHAFVQPTAGTAVPGKASLVKVVLPTVVVVLALNLAVRGFAVAGFQVPSSALPILPLILASVGATFGPAFGFYMSFRRPAPDSMRKFLIPCAVLTFVGIVIEVIRFSVGHGHVGALVVGASQGVVAIGLALLALLAIVKSPREQVR